VNVCSLKLVILSLTFIITMNHNQYRQAIERELSKLNKEIDVKIITGLDYHDDARRHRQLLTQMRRMSTKSYFWPRAFRLVSTFLF
jgi:hypothetical protein